MVDVCRVVCGTYLSSAHLRVSAMLHVLWIKRPGDRAVELPHRRVSNVEEHDDENNNVVGQKLEYTPQDDENVDDSNHINVVETKIKVTPAEDDLAAMDCRIFFE